MFVSPAEPAQFKVGKKVSSLCEIRGADFLFVANGEWVGVQRKEINDFLASAADGRLQKELMQLQTCHHRVLIIEGKLSWTLDGEMMGKGYGRTWTRKQWRAILWGVRAKGVWIEYTDDGRDTINCLDWLESWFTKHRHSSLERRPGPVSLWGNPSNEDYQKHLVMGLPGVGSELADRIVKHFKGVPFQWKVSVKDLMEVQGIGKKKAEQIYGCLQTMETEG